jgi:hypothetical protein
MFICIAFVCIAYIWWLSPFPRPVPDTFSTLKKDTDPAKTALLDPRCLQCDTLHLSLLNR